MTKYLTTVATGFLAGLALAAMIVTAQAAGKEIVISQEGKKFVPGTV